MPHLADEILVNIFQNLCGHCTGPDFPAPPISKTLRSVALASRRFHRIAEPFLYHAFSSQASDGIFTSQYREQTVIANSKPLLSFLQTIITRPELASQVRILDLTLSCTPKAFFEGSYDSLREDTDENDDPQEDIPSRGYHHVLRLIYLHCLDVVTLNLRQGFSPDSKDTPQFTIQEIKAALHTSVHGVLNNNRGAGRLRTFNLQVDRSCEDFPLGEHHLTPTGSLQDVHTLTVVRPGKDESGWDEFFPRLFGPSVRWPRVKESFLNVRELSLLGLNFQDSDGALELISRCIGLCILRYRILDSQSDSHMINLSSVLKSLQSSRNTLQYLEFSMVSPLTDGAGYGNDLRGFIALKTLRINSKNMWHCPEEVAEDLQRARPDVTWLGTSPASRSENLWNAISWLPPALERLDIASISPCELEFVPCLALAKAACYTGLVDLRVSFSKNGSCGCDDGEWEDTEVPTRCRLPDAYQGQFEILLDDELLDAAGIRVRPLENEFFWRDVYSCEEVD